MVEVSSEPVSLQTGGDYQKGSGLRTKPSRAQTRAEASKSAYDSSRKHRLHDCPFPTCDCMVFQPRVTSCHLQAATEQKFRWFIPPSVPFPAASW